LSEGASRGDLAPAGVHPGDWCSGRPNTIEEAALDLPELIAKPQVGRPEIGLDNALAQTHSIPGDNLRLRAQIRRVSDRIYPEVEFGSGNNELGARRCGQLSKCDAHRACQKQWIHLCLAPQDARGDPERQTNDFALDLGEVMLALAAEAIDQLGYLAQPFPLGPDDCPCLCLALRLATLDAALVAARLKRAAGFLCQAAIEFKTRSFRSFAMCLFFGLGICTGLKEGGRVRRR
jgi:hypothetical protein